ncbi:MAG: membrane protein insertion efficiency factor YidD [bacterium]
MRRIMIYFIRAYRAVISPLFGPSCRFVPTCSRYAEEALEKYGAARGSFYALRRILKCRPFGGGGYDPL